MSYEEEDAVKPSMQSNQNLKIKLQECMHFESKETTISIINHTTSTMGTNSSVWNESLTYT